MEFDGLGVSAIVLHGGGEAGKRVGPVAVGVIVVVHVEVFKVFFLDRVLQRLVEQIIETSSRVHVEEMSKVFSQDRSNVVVEQIIILFSQDRIHHRFAEQNIETSVWRGSGGAVQRRDEAFGRIPHIFPRARAVLT